MLISLLGKLDKKKPYWVGVSGGADSMAALHFLKQMKYDVQPVFFHHDTAACRQAKAFLDKQGINYDQGSLETPVPAGKSKEEHWRNERYKFFKRIGRTVIVAHHLDDVVETWVWGSLHGQSKLIPYRHANVIRPFLATPKAELVRWCQSHGIEWIEDFTNADTKHQRNYIRHTMMPHVLAINPGIAGMLRKKLLARGVDKIADL